MKQQPGSEVMPTCRSSSWAARRAAPSLMGAQLFSRWSGESKSSLRRNWTEKKAAITNINLTLEVVLSFKTLTYWRRWKNTFQQLESHTLSKSSLSYTSLPALLSEMMYNLQFGQIYYREMPWNMCMYIYIYSVQGVPSSLWLYYEWPSQCYVQVSLSRTHWLPYFSRLNWSRAIRAHPPTNTNWQTVYHPLWHLNPSLWEPAPPTRTHCDLDLCCNVSYSYLGRWAAPVRGSRSFAFVPRYFAQGMYGHLAFCRFFIWSFVLDVLEPMEQLWIQASFECFFVTKREFLHWSRKTWWEFYLWLRRRNTTVWPGGPNCWRFHLLGDDPHHWNPVYSHSTDPVCRFEDRT